MGSDSLLRAVRQQLSLGRLVPLGEPADRVWLAERAAVPVLREAAESVSGVSVVELRLALAGPATAAVPEAAPPSALPPGPLRIEARLAAGAVRPLHETAARVRAALAAAADDRIGLVVTAVDVAVVDLLPAPAGPPSGRAPRPAAGPAGGAAARVAAAVLRVPGVRGLSSAVEVPEGRGPVRVRLAVDGTRRTLDAARAASRAAATAAGRPAAVLVTDIAMPG
ncbi:hypothetical protein [Streptomyces johnsoniae]|uniref:Nucleopolyhedrovirus P10 family protein n=1 Tax=Streptomyces johnsoniae TaxID=3075532 RepID=A0ABU2S763_9ACTN|nr:hypothetical protein [Streptomyces sp. DSM 41886]MDT0444822.1 hypothetical protein [Streptomyces sp. DSM 41886]